jgi:hypothetical protein
LSWGGRRLRPCPTLLDYSGIRIVGLVKSALDGAVVLHVDNLLLSPFAVPSPPTDLPPALLDALVPRLRPPYNARLS